MGSAANRKEAADTALPHRNAAYSIHNLTAWSDATNDYENISRARDFQQALAPYAMREINVSLLSLDEEERVKGAYRENWIGC